MSVTLVLSFLLLLLSSIPRSCTAAFVLRQRRVDSVVLTQSADTVRRPNIIVIRPAFQHRLAPSPLSPTILFTMKTSETTPDPTSQAVAGKTAAAAPMYITIGPQCCGKSTWLRNINTLSSISSSSRTGANVVTAASVVDVCIDDQPGVYMKVPIDMWLLCADEKGQLNEFLSTERFGKTVCERIRECNELTLILQRWTGRIDGTEFSRRLTLHYQQKQREQQDRQQRQQRRHNNDNAQVSTSTSTNEEIFTHCQAVITAVETFLVSSSSVISLPLGSSSSESDHEPPPVPDTVDLFILEALFQPDPDCDQQSQNTNNGNDNGIVSNMSAIDRAHAQLRSVPPHVPVAWGNTNSKARDYQVALDIAYQTKRPVQFVLCHPSRSNKKMIAGTTTSGNSTALSLFGPSSDVDNDGILTIPWLSFSELFQRNLQRFAATGRYIPSTAITDCMQRVASIIPTTPTTSSHKHMNTFGQNSHNHRNNADSTPSAVGAAVNSQTIDLRRILVSEASSRSHEFIVMDDGRIEKRLRQQGNGPRGRVRRGGLGDSDRTRNGNAYSNGSDSNRDGGVYNSHRPTNGHGGVDHGGRGKRSRQQGEDGRHQY